MIVGLAEQYDSKAAASFVIRIGVAQTSLEVVSQGVESGEFVSLLSSFEWYQSRVFGFLVFDSRRKDWWLEVKLNLEVYEARYKSKSALPVIQKEHPWRSLQLVLSTCT